MNRSFEELSDLLKSEGITNNSFFLETKDPSLVGVDPYNPKLSKNTQKRIIKECEINYWYFLREVLRVPDQGNGSVPYKLHKGNLAIHFCMLNNFNIICELSKQHGMVTSITCRIIWEFLFAGKDLGSSFIDKTVKNSEENLTRAKLIIAALPEYLILNKFTINGEKIRYVNNKDRVTCPTNKNFMSIIPSKRIIMHSFIKNKAYIPKPRQWYNNFVQIQNVKKIVSRLGLLMDYNRIFPKGTVITTHSGDVNNNNQLAIYNLIQNSSKFNEKWYDLSVAEIKSLIMLNYHSNFIYIRYTYNQMGSSEEWYRNICIEMLHDTECIDSEILLKWKGVN